MFLFPHTIALPASLQLVVPQQQAVKQISVPAQLTNAGAAGDTLVESATDAQRTMQEASPTDMSVDRANPLYPWERLTEDGTGETYYENIITMATSWTLPAVLHTQDGWEKLFDEESGDCYWLNLDNGLTTWHNPWASAASKEGRLVSAQHQQAPPSAADAIALISSRVQKQQQANSAHEMPPQSARHHTSDKNALPTVRHESIHLVERICFRHSALPMSAILVSKYLLVEFLLVELQFSMVFTSISFNLTISTIPDS
jgi:hypothetical protein